MQQNIKYKWPTIKYDNRPKQLPRYGMNILHAVAIGNSTDISVLIITSSMDIISAK